MFEDYAVAGRRAPDRLRRLVVTAGTISPYRFDRLVNAALEVAPLFDEVVWQLGTTLRTGLPGRAVDYLPEREFDDVLRSSDVVISHAGVGTVLHVLATGHVPLLVPRRGGLGEHIDDHQLQLASRLAERDLAVMVSGETISVSQVQAAAAAIVRPLARTPVNAIGDLLPEPRTAPSGVRNG